MQPVSLHHLLSAHCIKCLAPVLNDLVGSDQGIQGIVPRGSRPAPVAKVRVHVPKLVGGEDHGALFLASLEELNRLLVLGRDSDVVRLRGLGLEGSSGAIRVPTHRRNGTALCASGPAGGGGSGPGARRLNIALLFGLAGDATATDEAGLSKPLADKQANLGRNKSRIKISNEEKLSRGQDHMIWTGSHLVEQIQRLVLVSHDNIHGSLELGGIGA